MTLFEYPGRIMELVLGAGYGSGSARWHCALDSEVNIYPAIDEIITLILVSWCLEVYGCVCVYARARSAEDNDTCQVLGEQFRCCMHKTDSRN